MLRAACFFNPKNNVKNGTKKNLKVYIRNFATDGEGFSESSA